MKICSKCGVEKPKTEFHKNKKSKDGLASWCKECNKSNAFERRENIKRFLFRYKSNNPCIKCGETDARRLQFHHVNPANKKYTIADMIRGRCSMKLIKHEISKCVILCEDCHVSCHKNEFDLSKYIDLKKFKGIKK